MAAAASGRATAFSPARIEDDEIYGHPFSSFPPPALACELFMELSGQCRLYGSDVLIAAMQPISISPPIFGSQRAVKIFWSKNRFFSAFAAHLCGMCKTSLG